MSTKNELKKIDFILERKYQHRSRYFPIEVWREVKSDMCFFWINTGSSECPTLEDYMNATRFQTF